VRAGIGGGLAAVSVLCLAGCAGSHLSIGPADQTPAASASAPVGATASATPFPTIPAAGLTAGQRKLLRILKAQYAAQPVGTAYSGGVREPWCADFATWVLKRQGHALVNPTSGGWRIPGVLTLLDAVRRNKTVYVQDAWTASDPAPRFGDLALYDGAVFGQHVNFILAYSDGRITTLGGNEHGRITISTHRLADPALGLLALARPALG
jgi:hypothetical protein